MIQLLHFTGRLLKRILSHLPKILAVAGYIIITALALDIAKDYASYGGRTAKDWANMYGECVLYYNAEKGLNNDGLQDTKTR